MVIRTFFINLLLWFSCLALSAQQLRPSMSEDAQRMEQVGLVNVLAIDSTLKIHLLYAQADNFVGEVMYSTLREAYLQPEAAKKLAMAHRALKRTHPHYCLVVHDAARPRSAQQLMWNKVKNTDMRRYVASPKRISMHSYGVAVDVSILDEKGNVLDMGTPVDHLGIESEPRREQELLRSGVLTEEQTNNRLLLRGAMKKAGFRTISNEWWHFEACTRAEAEQRYKPID